jgi:hypothetical protein
VEDGASRRAPSSTTNRTFASAPASFVSAVAAGAPMSMARPSTGATISLTVATSRRSGATPATSASFATPTKRPSSTTGHTRWPSR